MDTMETTNAACGAVASKPSGLWRKAASVLLALVLAVGVWAAVPWEVSAEILTGECGENATYLFDNTTGELTISGSGDIETMAFYGGNIIKNVTISYGITGIGSYAFAWTSLVSLTLPNSVKNIASGAFIGCSSLTSITIPSSVVTIGENAFFKCTSLDTVTIHKDAKTREYSYSAFNDRSENLKIFGYSGSEAEQYAFYNNIPFVSLGVVEKRVVNSGDCGDKGNNVTWNLFSDGELVISGSGNMKEYTMGAWASSWLKVKTVKISNGVTSIGSNAFSRCSSLESIIIPNSVTSINYGAFQGCSSLKSISLPNTLVEIGDYAFSHCSSLQQVNIPNSVLTIGDRAFSYCTSLKSISIPNSATKISGSFTYCSSLQSVSVASGATNIWKEAFVGTPWYDSLPNGSVYLGKTLYTYKGELSRLEQLFKQLIIEDGTTNIMYHALSHLPGLTSVLIPASVTHIGEYGVGYKRHYVESSKWAEWVTEKIDGFTIYGYKNTEAEKYANDNGFEFFDLHTHTFTNYKTTAAATHTTVGKETGTCACGATNMRDVAKTTAHTYGA